MRHSAGRIGGTVRSLAARAAARLPKRRGDIRVRVHGVSLLLPRDHALPRFVRQFPSYSTNAVRVATSVAGKYANTPLIDVGANVGDTVRFLRSALPNPILAVEGDSHWWPYLEANTRGIPDVTMAKVFLGDSAGTRMLDVERREGTTTFTDRGGRGTEIEVYTAAMLLDRNAVFAESRFVKVDTDGHDYAVVQSFMVAPLRQDPVFFFEHDPSLNRGGVRASEDLRQALVARGYRRALWWDNFGRFVLTGNLEDRTVWTGLATYVPAPGSAFYWDIAVFPGDDHDLADSLAESELRRARESMDQHVRR